MPYKVEYQKGSWLYKMAKINSDIHSEGSISYNNSRNMKNNGNPISSRENTLKLKTCMSVNIYQKMLMEILENAQCNISTGRKNLASKKNGI